ncbi:MAG: GNAT family N-acetyltransferase [Trueperaceae bacterium]|nr:GNAT family N-acetyltransferase [Trueperaceae bacterium]
MALLNLRSKSHLLTIDLSFGRVSLRPLSALSKQDWQRIAIHFRDSEIAHLNGTPPNRMPLWFLKRVLKADSRRPDRETFGIYDEHESYIGTIELYDIGYDSATLGIIIGERSHWSKGYGPEAIYALLSFAFHDLHLRRVTLSTFEDNLRAQTAFKKAGFRELRRIKNYQGRVDVQMEISKPAWLEHKRQFELTGHFDTSPSD